MKKLRNNFMPTGIKIVDEFTNLHISRQRKYHLRNIRDGRCTICGSSLLVTKKHCREHAKAANKISYKSTRNRKIREERIGEGTTY